MLDINIRPEERADAPAIHAVIVAAFEEQPYSNHNEHHIADKLRESNALLVSLVAVLDAAVVGHIAFSPVTIDGKFCAWYGLGPLSVAPSQASVLLCAKVSVPTDFQRNIFWRGRSCPITREAKLPITTLSQRSSCA